MDLTEEQFEQLVVKALDSLPPSILAHMENVDVVIEDWPSPEDFDEYGLDENGTMLGLYEGVPHIDRSSGYGLVLPDKITIFAGPVLNEASDTDGDVERVVRETVIHEIAHHFGITDERLLEIDRY
ncbi:MAG: metallopeptidase family protein [Sphaerobacteraceae bacterium]|nr:MAG: metallopeptidase family protein [Sphaerobacteraceae bacterium]